MLPGRDKATEDAWIQSLDGGAVPHLIDACLAAMDAGRPGLAARVLSLLEDEDIPDVPELERARRAARLLLLAPVDRRGPIIAELEAEVASLRRAHVARARARQRRRARGDDASPLRRKPRGSR